MNLLKILLEPGVYNMPELEKIEDDNKKMAERLSKRLEAELGYKISTDVLKILAFKKFLECYDLMEVIHILDYYKQLKGR